MTCGAGRPLRRYPPRCWRLPCWPRCTAGREAEGRWAGHRWGEADFPRTARSVFAAVQVSDLLRTWDRRLGLERRSAPVCASPPSALAGRSAVFTSRFSAPGISITVFSSARCFRATTGITAIPPTTAVLSTRLRTTIQATTTPPLPTLPRMTSRSSRTDRLEDGSLVCGSNARRSCGLRGAEIAPKPI